MKWRTTLILSATLLASPAVGWSIWEKTFWTRWPGPLPPDVTTFQRRFGPDAVPAIAAKLDDRLPIPFPVDGPAKVEMYRMARQIGVNLFLEKQGWSLESEAQITGDYGGLTLEQALLKAGHAAKPGTAFGIVATDDSVIHFGDAKEVNPEQTAPRTVVYSVGTLVGTSPDHPGLPPLATAIQHAVPNVQFDSAQRDQFREIKSFATKTDLFLIATGGMSFHGDIARVIARQKQKAAVRWLAIRLAGTEVATLTLAIAAIHLLHLKTRRDAKRSGLCPGCGYDLRESPHRCPECGLSTPPSSAPAIHPS